jgi:tRNA1(Val) A37 N6-methylase TrmN6
VANRHGPPQAIVRPRPASHKSPGFATGSAPPAKANEDRAYARKRFFLKKEAKTSITEGTLLGGAIRYAQPAAGYRTGIEPVFLAASVPARAGERVLEAGTGAGAALLCLTHRVAGITGLGVEIEPAMAAIATANLAANGQTGITILTGDICALAKAAGVFDHAMANPPWHDAAGTRPTGALKQRARMAPSGLATAWIAAMAGALRVRGTLTLILPPRAVPESLAALAAAECGSPLLYPLWPKPGREARMVLLQAIKGGRAEFRLRPGLVLHDEAGYTEATEAILRRGEPLALR